MTYKEKIVAARFIDRPNRFIAHVEVDGEILTVHVKNTGRCRELLVPNCKVYLAMSGSESRKTPADIIAVEKQTESGDSILINMDSQVTNTVAEEWIRDSEVFSTTAIIKREVCYGSSRFDIAVTDGDRRAFIEVKGVTLENGGTVMFPDAPTERGIKHLDELISCMRDGYEAYIIFVVQMKEATLFKPNKNTHPEFADKLSEASSTGVNVIAITTEVTPNTIKPFKKINIQL